MALAAGLLLAVPLALAGLALLNTGLGRARSAAHALYSALLVVALAACVYFAWGFAVQGLPGHGGRPFLAGLALDGSPASLAACLGLFSAALASLIPLGSGAERWSLRGICLSTVLLAGCTYPVFAGWVWGGGWLAQLGVRYGLGRGFVDAGGSACIQAVGGLTALSLAWILGPRQGKFSLEGMPAAIPGHNAVFVLFGCLVAWVGWMALNAAGALLHLGAAPGAVVLAAFNTTLSAAGGLLAAAFTTRLRFGKPDASLSANGWMGGLAAGSAGCVLVVPAAALIIGLAAGALVALSVEWLELRLGIDDPGGAISVHAVAGIWGVLAAGIFVPGAGQFLAQIVGLATLLGFVLPVTYGFNCLLNRVSPQRVRQDGERQGLDLHELGAGAYPEPPEDVY